MPSWDEVRAYLRGKLTLARDEHSMVGVVWRFPDKDKEIVQGVRLSPIEHLGEPWIAFLSDVCHEDRLPLREAVLHQSRLPFGALVVAKSTWLLRHSMPLPHLDWVDLENAIRYTAMESARLRMILGEKGKDPALFSAYED